MALGPDLLIADKHVGVRRLSPSVVLELFGELQSALGFGCLFITHDLAEVDQLCDWVTVLRGGEFVEEGARAVILQSPARDDTRALVAAAPVADPDVQRSRRVARRCTRQASGGA